MQRACRGSTRLATRVGVSSRHGAECAKDLDLPGGPPVAFRPDGDLADHPSAPSLYPMKTTGGADVVLPRGDPIHRSDARIGEEPADGLLVAHPPLATRMSWAASHAP